MFTWKKPKDIWKGEGIYHVTWNIAGKIDLLGTVCGQSKEVIAETVKNIPGVHDITNKAYVDTCKDLAWVNKTSFGKAVDRDIANFEKRHPGVKVCQYKTMDTHIHAVLWVYKPQKQSILEMGQGFRTGITHIAKDMGVWPCSQEVWDEAVVRMKRERLKKAIRKAKQAAKNCAPHAPVNIYGKVTSYAQHATAINQQQTSGTMNVQCLSASMVGEPVESTVRSVSMEEACGASITGVINVSGVIIDTKELFADIPLTPPYHVLEIPFVRTCVHKGQKRSMIDYVALNVYRKWITMLYKELFTVHHTTIVEGLRFKSLGNHWLLDWPLRQMVSCSRTATPEEVNMLLEKVLENAKAGYVTYMASVNDNEDIISDALRAGDYPLVLHLKDGFAGADDEDFKPGGRNHDACGQGRILFFEAKRETYEDPRIIEATNNALKQKAYERHQYYNELPHSTRRWMYMAGNEMMRLLAERGNE